MEYKASEPEKDFVRRTFQLAKELKDHEYSTTLQINLLLGTVLLPKSRWYTELDQHIIDCNEITGVTILYKPSTQVSLKVLLHCLRNGIAHWSEHGNSNVKFETEMVGKQNEISKVKIFGSGKVDGQHESINAHFDLSEGGIIHFMEKIYTCLK